MKTNTPETDSIAHQVFENGARDCDIIMIRHARKLERDRDDAIVKATNAVNDIIAVRYQLAEAHRKASEQYEKAVQYYYQCEEDQVNSFLAHNDASYWKGRRDALRHLIHFLPNDTAQATPTKRP